MLIWNKEPGRFLAHKRGNRRIRKGDHDVHPPRSVDGGALVAAAPFVIKTANAQETAANAGAASVDLSSLTRRKVKLVAPPFVHAHDQVATTGPEIIEFEMRIVEKEIQVDEDAWLQAMTFNGSVPGPMMVVHEGDYVELTLFNSPENTMQHNIDFHAATGALGGGALTLVNPGEKAVLRFKATRPGVFVYHCAPGGPMIPWHVVSGMSGCIMVLPRNGLKDHLGQPVSYDRIYYIGENDFYIPRGDDGAYMRFADPGESYSDTLKVMNGSLWCVHPAVRDKPKCQRCHEQNKKKAHNVVQGNKSHVGMDRHRNQPHFRQSPGGEGKHSLINLHARKTAHCQPCAKRKGKGQNGGCNA